MLVRVIASLMLGFGVASAASVMNTSAVYAQEMDRVAAVVNEEIISLSEVMGRVNLAVISSNLPDNADSRRRVLPQVIGKMIDERLQTQEAARVKIALTEEELAQGIRMIEQQNNMSPGKLLAELEAKGVDPVLVREQIRSDLTWMRVTARMAQALVRVGEEEITDRLETIKARQGRPEYFTAEIVLPVEDYTKEEETRRLGERLIEQLRSGTPFQVLAQQFSRSPTASNGGAMGWVAEDGFEPEVLEHLANLSKNSITPLVRTPGGYNIVLLLNTRTAGTAVNAIESIVTLEEMLLPVPKGAPQADILAQANQVASAPRSCAQWRDMAKRMNQTVKQLGTAKIADLDPTTQQAVAETGEGRVGRPHFNAAGTHVRLLMVCKREDTRQFVLPSRDQVRQNIEQERTDMLARRTLRDLRRSAFIDVRL